MRAKRAFREYVINVISKETIESGRRNFMYGPAGPDLAKNLRHIFHLEMRTKSFLDIK